MKTIKTELGLRFSQYLHKCKQLFLVAHQTANSATLSKNSLSTGLDLLLMVRQLPIWTSPLKASIWRVAIVSKFTKTNFYMFSTAKNLNLLSPLYKRFKKTRKNFRMPPQKKPPKNGFSFYMDDYIPGLKRQGIQINHKRTFFLVS